MPQIEKTEKRERIKISKLHFLIHPGSTTDPDEMDHIHDHFEKEKFKHRYDFLPERYLEKAQEMKSDELMMAFLHTKGEKIKQDIRVEKEYIKTLKKLKKILGTRLIVMSNKFDITNDAEAYETAKKILEARGYYFDQDVFAEAFGECQSMCVRLGKKVIEQAGGFKDIGINQKLTDGALNQKKRGSPIINNE